MNNLLEALEITTFDARSMFKLLDLDDSGKVDIDEFCEGCLRLKGDARSFDINCMMYESRALLRLWVEFMEDLECRFEQIHANAGDVSALLENLNYETAGFAAERHQSRLCAMIEQNRRHQRSIPPTPSGTEGPRTPRTPRDSDDQPCQS